MKTVSYLFKKPPAQWGLRGDPWLWNEMKTRTEQIAMPNSVESVELLLHELFLELTGSEVELGKNIFVRRYADESSGMSKGQVSCNFWINKGFPLLLEQYNGDKS